MTPSTSLFTADFTGISFFGNDILQLILHAGPMVKFILLILLGFSVVSWAIILMKFRLFRKARMENMTFFELFSQMRDMKQLSSSSESLAFSPVANLFRSGHAEFLRLKGIQSSVEQADRSSADADRDVWSQKAIMENLERSLRKATIDQSDRLERSLSFLATSGNTAPFIGLFGTVWGIMDAFRGIGLKGAASLAVVAPGISEALVATAAGLAAAIPAVVAFNYFTHRAAGFRAEMDIFTSDFLSTAERQLYKKHLSGKAVS
ncbi:MAG: Tol-Pal system subunit TolQ [Desulfobacteraceae bacterium]|jgi:biopolymer transport protein TolQ|nr:MAG: Tol-Pal system subunit TolQ [Desulfobacteraceae bacterium]